LSGIEELCAKLRMLIREVQEALDMLRDYSRRDFAETSIAERLAARYNLIVVVEALADIAYVASRIMGREEPQGYVDALAYLSRISGVEEHVESMKALARLRNLLVHRYWVIDDARIHAELKRDLSFVKKVLDGLRGVLRVCWEEGS